MCQLTCYFFLHESHYMSNSKLCVTCILFWCKFLSVTWLKIAKTMSKIHTNCKRSFRNECVGSHLWSATPVVAPDYDQCVCLINFIWRSTSNPKCHMMFSKTKRNVNWHLHCLLKCHLNVTCLIMRVISICKVSIDVWFFSFTSHIDMSKSKLCMPIDVQFIFVQFFVCQLSKTCKKLVEKTHWLRHPSLRCCSQPSPPHHSPFNTMCSHNEWALKHLLVKCIVSGSCFWWTHFALHLD